MLQDGLLIGAAVALAPVALLFTVVASTFVSDLAIEFVRCVLLRKERRVYFG